MAQIIFAILAGVIPAIFWLWFWLREDDTRPAPKPLIGKIFLFRCLAIIPAYFLEKSLGASSSLAFLDNLFWMVILLAVIEESLKYSAVYVGALKTRFYDEPVDAMIYMVTAALGFAAVENTLFLLSDFTNSGNILESALIGNFRFLGATLVHVIASAIIGSVIGLTFKQWWLKKLAYFTAGFLLAVGLHALFNYFIIKSGSDGGQLFKIFGLLWLAGVVIIFLFEKVKQPITQKNISSI